MRMPRPLAVALAATSLLATACASRPRVGDPDGASGGGGPGRGGPPGARRGDVPSPLLDMAPIYQQMGLLVPRGDLPVVANVAYFARSPDSTLAIVTVSFANRALAFTREGDRYRAAYQVRLEMRPRDAAPDGAGASSGTGPGTGSSASAVRQLVADEVVRVATFRETARTDESVLFSQALTLAPGRYALSLAVRDAGAARSSVLEVPVVVPRLGPGTLSTPVLAYEVAPRVRLDTLPRLVASPRAAVTFGQDSLVPVYVEAYAAGGADAPARVPVRAAVRAGDATLWQDTVAFDRRVASIAAAATAPLALYSGVVRIPVARAGIGVVALDVVRTDRASGASGGSGAAGPDSTRAALFVSLGEDLPVASFEQMVDYLRFFATPERLRGLRDGDPEARSRAWALFLRETDPVSATAQHEGLRDYFARLRTANQRFREEGTAGWLTDRGRAYMALGEPDQIFDPNAPEQNVRGRTQVWQYREQGVTLAFVDQNGFGRWRLSTQSAGIVEAALRRRMVQ